MTEDQNPNLEPFSSKEESLAETTRGHMRFNVVESKMGGGGRLTRINNHVFLSSSSSEGKDI